MPVEALFPLLAAVVFAGFFSRYLFERTRIPDVLLLMGAGLLLGPVLHLLDPQRLVQLLPYVGPLALTFVLFDAGLDLSLDRVLGQFGRASALVLASFTVTAAAIAALCHYAFGASWIAGVLLGAVTGSTSAGIVVPLLLRMPVREETRSILSLESAISSVLAVVLTLSLSEIGHRPSYAAALRSLSASFFGAAVTGVVFGLLWTRALQRLQSRPFSHMLTVAALFLVYGVASAVHGNGPATALIFGLVLGNVNRLFKWIGLHQPPIQDEKIRSFQTEITFFVRTFFFVYLGAVFALPATQLTENVFITWGVVSCILLVRVVAARGLTLFYREERIDAPVLWTMIPRGLDAAVLASLPAAAGVPGTAAFLAITVAVILATNVVTAIGSFSILRRPVTNKLRPLVPDHTPSSGGNGFGGSRAMDRDALALLASRGLGGRKLVLASHREPYTHVQREGAVVASRGIGGVATALNSIMRACRGTWVALGTTEADRRTVDSHDRVELPPGDPAYTLRRLFPSDGEMEGYYRFANTALWPLCHIAYERPVFDADDWKNYVAVNRAFADAVLEEAGRDGVVFLQDYQLSLVAGMLKERRPELPVVQFWHIPWPNSEAFRVCPWTQPILEGLLANDLLGFHVQLHCSNFLETCERELELRYDREHDVVIRGGRSTFVRPFPISVDYAEVEHLAGSPEVRAKAAEFRARFAAGDAPLIVAVDRLDYSKGILERLDALETYLSRGDGPKPVLIQVGVPTREQIEPFRQYREQVTARVEAIRVRHGNVVHLLAEQLDFPDVIALYTIAQVAWVSSRHDGMNLVSKEFAAARTDGDGVLILSRWTGAARELQEALLVNPYDVSQMADALRQALTMAPEERRRRMSLLRERVHDHTVFDWAAGILARLARIAHGLPGGAIGSDVWAAPVF